MAYCYPETDMIWVKSCLLKAIQHSVCFLNIVSIFLFHVNVLKIDVFYYLKKKNVIFVDGILV